MAKEFNKKFMHPTRRKLADMVKTGKYESNTTVGWTPKKEIKTRKVGDVWEDDSFRYEQKEGYFIKSPKNARVFHDIRNWLNEQKKCKGDNCQTKKISKKDEKLIIKTGFCINCLADIETKIRIAGVWDDYKNYRIWTRMLLEGKMKIEELKEAHDTVKQTYENVLENGEIEKWTLPRPVDEVKSEMKEIVEKWEVELNELVDKREVVANSVREAGFGQYL
jgi:hypothetical protein